MKTKRKRKTDKEREIDLNNRLADCYNYWNSPNGGMEDEESEKERIDIIMKLSRIYSRKAKKP